MPSHYKTLLFISSLIFLPIDGVKTEEIYNSNFYINNKQKDLYQISDAAKLPNPNLIYIDGPKITIAFKDIPAKEAISYLISKIDYDYVWVKNDPSFSPQGNPNKVDNPRFISLSLKDKNFSDAFNAVLLTSGLQAKIENNIIYVGPNIKDRVFSERFSKIYKLNQTSANAAASYLANLGAKVTKTSSISTAVTEGATQSQSVSGGTSTSTTTTSIKTSVDVYGSNIGPLLGLFATTDDRLQTINLIGSRDLVSIAEGFLDKIDKKQRQVALTVKILDVNISDGNTIDNSWSLRQENNFIVNDNGKLLAAFGSNLPPDETGDFSSATTAAIKANPGLEYLNNTFIKFLRAQIESKDTKILASPTLILNEYPGKAGGQSISFSSISSSLSTGSIGRSFGNEAFVIVGTQVPVNCTAAQDSTVPTFDYGIKGLTFGARILKIDDEGYVTFAISPSVTAPSEQRNIVNCGTIDLLATRRLDSGTIRVKDGHTLIMTGVLNSTDKETIKKFPLLGDIPLIGNLFKSKANSKEESELVILVTPKILKYEDQKNKLDFEYEAKTNEVKSFLDNKKNLP